MPGIISKSSKRGRKQLTFTRDLVDYLRDSQFPGCDNHSKQDSSISYIGDEHL